MGRELQKKKRRAKRPPVRPNKPAKVLNPRGNTLIAKHWDKKETLSQNYRRLGLVARLKGPTGGIEKTLSAPAPAEDGPFAIATVDKAVVSEARVERDAAGRIVRVLGSDNPLNDPLGWDDDDDDDDDDDEWAGIPDAGPAASDVVRSLVEQARNPAPKRPRHQSDGERQWLQRLVASHGDDTAAMARDLKLNPMQQTAADIAKRIRQMPKAA